MKNAWIIAVVGILAVLISRSASAYEPTEKEIEEEIEDASWRTGPIFGFLGGGPVFELGQKIVALERKMENNNLYRKGEGNEVLGKEYAKLTREYAIAALKLVNDKGKK